MKKCIISRNVTFNEFVMLKDEVLKGKRIFIEAPETDLNKRRIQFEVEPFRRPDHNEGTLEANLERGKELDSPEQIDHNSYQLTRDRERRTIKTPN